MNLAEIRSSRWDGVEGKMRILAKIQLLSIILFTTALKYIPHTIRCSHFDYMVQWVWHFLPIIGSLKRRIREGGKLENWDWNESDHLDVMKQRNNLRFWRLFVVVIRVGIDTLKNSCVQSNCKMSPVMWVFSKQVKWVFCGHSVC